jgi:phosphatidylglycerol---prolipoprotein diacylglyceryl transferase
MIWNIDPVITTLGPLTLGWYGVLFAGGFLVGVNVMQWIYRRESRDPRELDRLLWFVLGGTLIGMRLVHCFFYDPRYFLVHPLEILEIWKGGYASHGGAIGLLLAVYLYCRAPGRPKYLWLLDRLAIAAVLTGVFIRIGNFFNSEIIGVPTDSAFGVIFQRIDPLPRHPVQLYEATAYLAIFGVMLWLYRTKRAIVDGVLTGAYLTLVFGARFALEFLKTPQAAYEAGNVISVGQYLSVPFVIVGLVLLIRARSSQLGIAKMGE